MKEKVLIVDRICKLIKDNDLTNQKVETELGWGSGAIKKFDNNRKKYEPIPLNDTVSCRGKVVGKLNKKDILEQD